MNSLNLLSSRVIGHIPSAPRPRSRSQGEILSSKHSAELLRGRSFSHHDLAQRDHHSEPTVIKRDEDAEDRRNTEGALYEKSPLLEKISEQHASAYKSRLRRLVKRITDALTALLTVIGAPVVYVVNRFRDEDGRISPALPIKHITRTFAKRKAGQSTASVVGLSNASNEEAWTSEKADRKRSTKPSKLQSRASKDSLISTTSESETDRRKPRQHSQNELIASRRSIRIKLYNSESFQQRKDHRTALSPEPPLTVDTIKSPTSPSSLKVTKYPHASQPPRPLIPRRQPSYSTLIPRSPSSRTPQPGQPQKTLILDLDETLIHSHSKGNRMSSGHMVEVKLNAPVALSPVTSTGPRHHQPPTVLGPQHPILYYVHKRPHCDEFLRKACKWYKLVVFTASVQEYADPVIDWLEQERKFFTGGRYYRQHCTFRNGAYIKDLASVEPNLSRVMILDNSPMSYIFHEDNAIPIEGWINDPTDNDLLHLIPLLEALQYVTDVRALLALRRGEAEAH